MKKVLLFLFQIIIVSAFGQKPKVELPEFKNTIYIADTVNSKNLQLEKVTAEIDIKIKSFGYGGSDQSLKIANNKSTVELSDNQAVFIVKLPEPDIDPSTYIELYSLTNESDRRSVKLSSREMFGKTRNVKPTIIELVFTKIETAIYLITPKNQIIKGSYCFLTDPSAIKSGVSVMSSKSTLVFAFDIK